MAVHEFLKTAGDVVAKAQEKRVEEVKAHIAKLLGGADEVDGLDIECDDDSIKIRGKCKSEEAREKAILLAGNIAGISKVFSDGLEVVGKTLKGDGGSKGRFYTIKSGDTLSRIAREFYGDAGKYMLIVKGNKGVITDPDKIYPGQVIRIPAQEK